MTRKQYMEDYLNPGETSSARIVRQLEENGMKMAGVCRREFFVERLGMPVIRSYKTGRDELLVFTESSWRKSSSMIIGRNHRGYPIIKSDNLIVASNHARQARRLLEAKQETDLNAKVDLLLWATQEMLKMQAKYS